MKNAKRILAILLAMVLMISFAACSTTTEPSKEPVTSPAKSEATNGTFRVGLECAYAPFNWTQQDNSKGAVAIEGGGFAGGYDVEIAKKIAKGLNKELIIVKTEWDGLSPALTSGKIDAIIAGMSATKERKETIDFSDNYYKSDLVVVVKKDGKYSGAKSINDFEGAKITGQLSTFHYTVIDQMKGVSKQTALEDFPTMIVALTSGKNDGYISERPGALSATAANPNLTFIAFDKDNGFKCDEDEVSIAVGVKKGSDITSKINEILKGISEDERVKLMNDAVINQPNAN